jgi:hypothetical protein
MRRAIRSRYALAALLVSAAFCTGVAQAAPSLPTPVCGVGPGTNCLTFDDFTSYSLAALNLAAGFGDLSPGDPFQVDSSGSAIAAALVIATGDANATKNQHLGITTDNAYQSPNNIHSGFANYLMTALGGNDGTQSDSGGNNQPDPINGFIGDNVRKAGTQINNNNAPFVPDANGNPVADGTLPLWDVTTAGLKTFLGGQNLVFYFNLNEENGGVLDSGQDMLGYMDVYLTDFGADGAPGGGDDIVEKFTLSGNNCALPGTLCSGITKDQTLQSVDPTEADDILPNATDKWAYVNGQVCISPTGTFLGAGTCADNGNPPGGTTVNQNLGANTAAFALYSAQLDNDVRTGSWDIMSVDLRMGHVGNGFEQLFILPTSISEPGTLAVVCAALFGLFRIRRRAKMDLSAST